MTAPAADVLQYGALGLLFVVLLAVGWALRWLLERLAATFDKQTAALDRITESLAAMQLAHATAHAELKTAIADAATSDDLTAMAKDLRDEIRQRAA